MKPLDFNRGMGIIIADKLDTIWDHISKANEMDISVTASPKFVLDKHSHQSVPQKLQPLGSPGHTKTLSNGGLTGITDIKCASPFIV